MMKQKKNSLNLNLTAKVYLKLGLIQNYFYYKRGIIVRTICIWVHFINESVKRNICKTFVFRVLKFINVA